MTTVQREPRERPILFSGPMVRAILDGTKTQTRRVVKPQPEHGAGPCHWSPTGWAARSGHGDGNCTCQPIRCPYGEPGDRLWVRETWRAEELASGLDGIRFRADDSFAPIEDSAEAADRWGEAHENGKHGAKWRPSIFMPRWASRLTLEVTGVRVERVQDITEEDARAEGVTSFECIAEDQRIACDAARRTQGSHPHTVAFASLWDGAYPGSWQRNDWVWVVEFRRVEADR